MLIPWKASPDLDHETLFLERYGRIRGWLLQLTDHDHELTEDLLHDAFIQFTFTRPDINSIQNLDGYLYALARNLHISQLRRTAHARFEQLSIVDYDSSEIGLRMVDPRDQIQVQDELRRVCRYACVRKETAWVASVLILRFFHGYYPSEIAQVLKNSRQSVDVLLRSARREVKAYLANPNCLSFMKGNPTTTVVRDAQTARTARTSQPSSTPSANDLLGELRAMIFDSRRGDCLPRKRLQVFYRVSSSEQFRCEELAHVVSCEKCLDEVNVLLNLSLLSARHPASSLGKDSRPKGESGGPGGDGPGGAAGGETSPREFIHKNRRRSRDTFEHRPQELHIAVNGFTLGSQRINSKLSEQTLDINLPEQISFVEVFSEQKIRLLFTNVEAPPGGSLRQPVRVELSDGRTLDLTLKFRSPWPTLYVAYHDPTYSEAEAAEIEAAAQDATAALPFPQQLPPKRFHKTSARNRFSRLIQKEWRRFNPKVFLRPGAVTAAFAAVLIAALLIFQMPVATPTVTAAELLRRSTVAEDATARQSGTVLHRTLNLEERSQAGDVIARRRVEVWHSTGKGVTARRLYDERDRLVAGEWRKADGARTLYRRGAKPREESANKKPDALPVNLDDAWQTEPSAKDFTALIRRADLARVEELPVGYVISYTGAPADSDYGLVKARLTLARGDLRPVAQTLVVRLTESETREFRFIEASFEKQPVKSVAPAIFDPEPELFEDVKNEGGRMKKPEGKAKTDSIHSSPPTSPPSEVASARLEIEVLNLLAAVGADLGEEVSVRRTTDAPLRVEAVVETERRKQEILTALHPVTNNSAVKIHVETAAEAIKRIQQARPPAIANVVRNVEPTSNAIPVDREVRRYLADQATPNERINEEVSRFANRTLKRSQQAVLHVWALRALTKRFSVEDLRTLDKGAREKWLAMIRKHAGQFQRETMMLRNDLSPVFDVAQSATATEGDSNITDTADLIRAVAQLVELGSANDAAIQSAFNISANTPDSSAIKTTQFWRALVSAEQLAAKIQRATQMATPSTKR